jgi:hypothetical protein
MFSAFCVSPWIEAQVLLFNFVFLYVYLSSVVGAGSCALGKTAGVDTRPLLSLSRFSHSKHPLNA